MMKNNKTTSLKALLFTLFFFSIPTMVWAIPGRDYDEVGYDDLLNELTAKREKIQQRHNSNPNPTRHIGIGFINSFSKIAQNRTSTGLHATGIQLSVGTDLISPEWYTELIFRNFSPNSNLNEETSLRELEGKIGYTNSLDNIWHYSISSGISDRFLKYSNTLKNISINEASPSLVVATSIFAQVHKNLSVGAELSGRTSMINSAAEQNSFDFALRLNTSL